VLRHSFVIRHSCFVIPSSFVIRLLRRSAAEAGASSFHMITLGDYLTVSGILFAIGFAGVMLRRNLIIILMSLELMLNAANLSLVAFSRFRVDQTGLPNYNAQVFVFFIITVAAAEVAVGLAILVALYRARQTTDVKDISRLKF
jgi:NADH-quinone oxidoreductase subunit K